MAFKVHRAGVTATEFSDKSTYEFLDGGLLKVTVKSDDGATDSVRTFSPSGWAEVNAQPDHAPGGPKGGKPVQVPTRIR